MSELSLTVQKRIPAPASRVYNAWLDPKMLAKFMLAAPDMTIPDATTDPRKGGRFNILMRMGANDLPHGGTYLDLQPHSRIVFTWESPYSVDGSTVTLDFVPDGDGTMVTLTHQRFATENSRDNHKAGWTAILANLAKVAA